MTSAPVVLAAASPVKKKREKVRPENGKKGRQVGRETEERGGKGILQRDSADARFCGTSSVIIINNEPLSESAVPRSPLLSTDTRWVKNRDRGAKDATKREGEV